MKEKMKLYLYGIILGAIGMFIGGGAAITGTGTDIQRAYPILIASAIVFGSCVLASAIERRK